MTRLAECWKTARSVEGPSVASVTRYPLRSKYWTQRAAAAVIVLGHQDGPLSRAPPRRAMPVCSCRAGRAAAGPVRMSVVRGSAVRVATPTGGFMRRPFPAGDECGLCCDCRLGVSTSRNAVHPGRAWAPLP